MYHFSPVTGKQERCKAKSVDSCKYTDELHAETKEELQVFIDLSNELDKGQLEVVKRGMKDGIDVSAYADPSYNPMQMQEIRMGLRTGVDVSTYTNPSLDFKEMNQIRRKLERAKWSNLDESQIDLMYHAIGKGLDVTRYETGAYSTEQMHSLIEWEIGGVDVSKIANPNLSLRKLMTLRDGLTLGFTEEQMQELSRESTPETVQTFLFNKSFILFNKFLSENISARKLQSEEEYKLTSTILYGTQIGIRTELYSRYFREGYSSEQIMHLLDGLMSGVDIQLYNKKDYSPKKMETIKHLLQDKISKDSVKRLLSRNLTDEELAEKGRKMRVKELKRMFKTGNIDYFSRTGEEKGRIQYALEPGVVFLGKDYKTNTFEAGYSYIGRSFNPEQMKEIERAYFGGIDISKIAKEDLSASDMRILINQLKSKR